MKYLYLFRKLLGGMTCWPGFEDRLLSELSISLPSVSFKICPPPRDDESTTYSIYNRDRPRRRSDNVNTVPVPSQVLPEDPVRYARGNSCWQGAAIFAHLSNMKEYCITADQFKSGDAKEVLERIVSLQMDIWEM